MSKYPRVIGELQTIRELKAGKSIARFGDGELRLCLGGNSCSQKATPALRAELLDILKNNQENCLVGIPHAPKGSPKESNWKKYMVGAYADLMDSRKVYHSAFISRPDSAPWIDTDEYWQEVIDLWRDRFVVVVRGPKNKSLNAERVSPQAAYVLSEIEGPHEDAYSVLDVIESMMESHIEQHQATFPDLRINPLILISLGAAGTVLAHRLAKKGLQALDLGHIGMFMRRRSLFNE